MPTFFIEHHERLEDGLKRLHDEDNIHAVLCETGPTLATTLLTSDLVDELRIHTAPIILGDGHRWHGPPSAWRHHDSIELGGDVLTTYLKA
jgi:riboflavin biosynthesis pyrimidine reductase